MRPRILRYIVGKETLERRIEERKAQKREERRKWAERAAMVGQDAEDASSLKGELVQPPKQMSWATRVLQCFHLWGLGEQKLVVFLYAVLNALIYVFGFCSNLGLGFKGSVGFPIAKGAGYMLDLNFAILILPTLKSLQTAMRHVSAPREWMPIDDPISFHIVVAEFILVGTLVHVGGHAAHMLAIATAPPLQHCVAWLPAAQTLGGMNSSLNSSSQGLGSSGSALGASWMGNSCQSLGQFPTTSWLGTPHGASGVASTTLATALTHKAIATPRMEPMANMGLSEAAPVMAIAG